ncbi:MAG: prepilin-type N-terminal cleavage/methylation domain-containing protein [Acidobacteriaceae bacterium]|nr:prepilin-type N-terminal cleavage/methylation domain-containing protein [Acidobacteriaceae bacterium]
MMKIPKNQSVAVVDQAGFTLVELLVALALLSVITTAILGGIDLTHRVWKTSPEREHRTEIETAAETLRTLLTQMLPAVAPGDDGMARLVFQGSPHELVAVNLSDGRSQVGGMALTRISFAKGKADGDTTATGQIRISSTVFRAGTAFAPAPADAATSALFHNVVSFDITYFGVVTPGKPPVWQNQWLGQDHLPELVSARVVLRTTIEPINLSIPVRIPTAQ